MKKVSPGFIKSLVAQPDDMLIRVYTYQHEDAYTLGEARGFITGNKQFIYDGFLEQYEWMRSQMYERIDGYSGEFPIWAYLKRPNLRKQVIDKHDVLITALIPKRRMLISDYTLWHNPLNNGDLCETEEESDAIYKLGENEQKTRIMETWPRVFNIDYEPSAWMGTGGYIQACIDRIYLSEIISIKRA